MVRIPLYEIRYVDVNLNYVTIYANKEYTLKRTFRDIEKDLDSRFVRVGRSIIINITFVQKVTKISVYLFDGTILERMIRVYMDMKKTQLYISFTNFTATKKLKKRGKRFATTKGEGHGFGLVRIDQIIERLDGYISRNSEDGAFTTEILIPQV